MGSGLVGHDQNTAAADPSAALHHALAQVQLSGAIFLHSEYTEGWAYESLPADDLAALLAPEAARIVLFHVIVSGSCWLEAGGHKVWANAGDVVVLPYNDQHRMGGHEQAEIVPVSQLLAPPPWNGLPHIVHGLGGARSEIVCGYLACDNRLFDPRLRVFPPVFVVTPPEGPARAWVRASSDLVLDQTSQTAAGGLAAPTEVPQLLLREVLKLHLSSAPALATGWLAALSDPVLAPALTAVHSDPAHHWTLGELAREAAVSSSVLDERCRRVLGMAPIRYLTGWRMHVAEELLRTTTLGISSIAHRVGYESEEAFSRAFKRGHGEAPSIWRVGR